MEADSQRQLVQTLQQAVQYYAHSGDVAYLLLPQRALLGLPNQHGDTPLHVAVTAGRREAVQALGRVMHREDLDAASRDGHTALHVACALGLHDIVQDLLDVGASQAVTDPEGATPLHAACRARHAQVVRVLVGAGCPVLAQRNHEGLAPLHVAVASGCADVVAALLACEQLSVDTQDASAGRTALHVAVRLGLAAQAEALLARGASACAQDYAGNTPLHVAADTGRSDLAGLLLTYGADVAAANHYGLTALALAHAHGHTAFGATLLQPPSHEQAKAPTDSPLDGDYELLGDDVTSLPSAPWELRRASLGTGRQAKALVKGMLRRGKRVLPGRRKDDEPAQQPTSPQAPTYRHSLPGPADSAAEKRALQLRFGAPTDLPGAGQGSAAAEKERLRQAYVPSDVTVRPGPTATPQSKAAEAQATAQRAQREYSDLAMID